MGHLVWAALLVVFLPGCAARQAIPLAAGADLVTTEFVAVEQNPVPGMHRYMPNAGYPETRAAVAEQFSLETGVRFGADDIILIL